MEWIILAVYFAIGIGVFAWYIHSNKKIDSDQKKRSARILIIFPGLCLFWPIVLFIKILLRRAVRGIANNYVEE